MRASSTKQRVAIFLTVLGAAFLMFLPATPTRAACAAAPGGKILAKNSYSPGETLEITYFYETTGGCTDADKPHVKITFNYDGTLYTLGEADCVLHDKGDGVFCELVGAKTFQFHIRKQMNWSGTAKEGYLEGWAYVQGTQVGNTFPPFKIAVGGGAQSAGAAAEAQKAPEPVETRLSVAIGGLTQTANIPLYISSLFNWGIGLVTIIAVSMVAWGGFKWLTAGGDSGRVTSAKETITNATIGLVLALGAYLILSTVNPDLVSLKPVYVEPVRRIVATQSDFCEDIVTSVAGATIDPPTGACGNQGKVKAPAGAGITKETCVFKNCPEGKSCLKTGNAYSCGDCEGISGTQLGDVRTVDDATCYRLSGTGIPKTKNSDQKFRACVFVNDTGIDTGCHALNVDCSQLKGKDCSAYSNVGVKGRAGQFNLKRERRCLFDLSASAVVTTFCMNPSIPNHFRELCNNDPCGLGGSSGCKIQLNPNLSYLQQKTGMSLIEALNNTYLVGKFLGVALQEDFGQCVPK